MSATQIAGQITSPTDINVVQTQGNSISATVTAPIAPNTFTFWAGFNGTNNMSSNPAYSGDVQSTAIGAMYKQIFEANTANVVAMEYDGVGTPGTAAGSSVFPTQQAIATATNAYNDFAEQANTWLQTHPGGSVTTMMASFSRGSIAAAVFSQMLFEKGLLFQGKMLVKPGQVGVSANLVISGVNTGGNGDVQFAPNVQNSVQVIASNEYRVAYEQDIYGGTTKVIYLPGNHGDLGGFYPGGLGAIYLQDYTDFMNAVNPGMAGTVLPSRQYQGGPVDIHAEVVDGITTLQNIANGSLADGTTTNTHNINPLVTSELTSSGDVLKFTDYKGDMIEAVRVGGVIQSITRTPSNQVGGPPVIEYKISTPSNVITTTNPVDGSTTVIAQNGAGITLQATTTLASGEIVQTNYANGEPSSVTISSIIASDGSRMVSLYDATGNALLATTTTHVVDNGSGLITTSEIAQDGTGGLIRVVETVQDLTAKVTTTTQLNLENGTVIGKNVTTIDNVAGTTIQNKFNASDVLQSNTVRLSSGEVDVTNYIGGQPIGITKTLQSGTGATTIYVFDGTGANLQSTTLINQDRLVDSSTGGWISTNTTTVTDVQGITLSQDVSATYSNIANRVTGNILTRYDSVSGVTTQTVATRINGNDVNVTYTYDPVSGEAVPHVNTINGKPPINQQMTDEAFKQVNPSQLATGSTGGADIGGTISANDAAHSTGAQTLAQAIATTAPTLIDALSLLNAIKTGQPLPILASGLRVANDLSPKVDALGNAIAPNYALNGAANAASGVLSLMSLDAALQRGDTLGALTSGAQALSFGTQAYANLVLNNSANLVGGSTQATYEFLNGTPGSPGVLPYLNIINSIAHGDSVGVAVAVVDMVLMDAAVYSVPYIGWAYAVYTMIDSLFSSADTPPEAWGSAHAQWSGFNATSSAVGGFGGLEAASQTYNGMLSYLDQLVAQQQAVNPSFGLGVIANRLPSLNYRNYSGYSITDIDPLTGVQNAPGTLYDLTGRPYNAPAGSPQASQSLTERMIRVALARGAIAPTWEVETAALQTLAGDPMAGLTEEERAGRAGKLAAPLAANAASQTFRPVALDLNGDGVQTTAAQTVAFDVDNSGYLKNTAWLSNSDGFLFLDRNLNGQIDAGNELFSNSVVSLGLRGLAGMRWVDSNYDGKLSALDPVWNELKVWQDVNGNGANDAGEVKSLAALGISALDYAMGIFTQNGQIKQMASPDLVADTAGTRTHIVPEGIIIQTSQGQTSLLVTQIDDKSLLEANRDGITSYEDTETIISAADLLANDTLAGLSGSNLSITGVSGFTHGTGFLDANGFIHYTPDANYFGAVQFLGSIGQNEAANDSVFKRRIAA